MDNDSRELSKKVLLFGSGYMAEEYLKVLNALQCETVMIGRNSEKAEKVALKYGVKGYGESAKALKTIDCENIDLAILATSIESLKELTCACLKQNICNILVEKPGALNIGELKSIKEVSRENSNIRIAYNRRFYNAVKLLKDRIAQDGGIEGCFFDFTDREMDVLDNPSAEKVIRRWGFANASHVIDTAFFLAGKPVEIECRQSGGWDVHPSGNVFVGSGRTDKCLFSYFATWAGGGRWNVEISTKRGRYKLSPPEKLQFCKKNQFSWVEIPPTDDNDEKFKPGVYKMVKAMLQAEEPIDLPGLDDQVKFCEVIDRIFGYGS